MVELEESMVPIIVRHQVLAQQVERLEKKDF
jgi:hypothetical protein